ncbi:FMN-binding protein [bacterium]|nr:FMN-binding protein [bacterium]
MLIVRLGLILMIVTSIAAGGLSLLNTQTAPIIAHNQAMEAQRAREEVTRKLGDVELVEVPVSEDFSYFRAVDTSSSEVVGYAGLAKGAGYSSLIRTMVGFDKNFEIVGMKIVFQQETPGLGTKAEEPAFLDQFNGVSGETVAVTKDGGTIDSITGATITSRAIAVSINDLVERIKSARDAAPSDTTVATEEAKHPPREITVEPTQPARNPED